MCVAVLNRVPSYMTFTWIRGKDADWLVRGWDYVQDSHTNQIAAVEKYRKSPVAEHLWCLWGVQLCAIWLRILKMSGFRA